MSYERKLSVWTWIVALLLGPAALPRPATSDDRLQQLPLLQLTASKLLSGLPLSSVSYSGDGNYAAACVSSSSGKVWIVNADTLAVVETLPVANVGHVQFAPRGRTLAIAGGPTLAIWDLDRRALEFIPKEFDENVLLDSSFGLPRFTPDGTRLVAAVGLDRALKTLSVWDPSTRRLERQLVGHSDFIWTIDISRDGRTLVSGDISGNIILWDLESGAVLQHIRKGDGTARAEKQPGFGVLFGSLDAVGFVGFVPTQDRVVAQLHALNSKRIEFWRQDETEAWKPDAPEVPKEAANRMRRGLAISPDGRFLAGTTTGKLGVLFDLQTRQPVATFQLQDDVRDARPGLSDAVIAFSPDGKSLIAASPSGPLCRFKLMQD